MNDILTLPMPAAVLFDMDGTLVDTDGLWLAAERGLYRECMAAGGAVASASLPAEVERALEGASLPECARVLRKAGVDLPAEDIEERLVASVERELTGNAIPWADGAIAFLDRLIAAGVPSVLVTGTPMRIVRHVLAAAPTGAFSDGNGATMAITGDSPLPAKPAPDRYREAARMAGARIERCLVVEDSGTGIRAGLASGARVVALTALARTPAPADPRYQRVRDFTELRFVDSDR